MISLSDILNREFATIDAFDGLHRAEELMDEKKVDSLIVMREGSFFGVLTTMDICKSHPNRIVADAMAKSFIAVSSDTSLWDVQALFEKYHVKEIVVMDGGKLIGVVSDKKIYMELGKRFDPLTGLFKTDYIYHHGMKLMEKGFEVSVIFIDLDKFGQIDKDYGHVQGDLILKEIAHIIERNNNKDAYLCRYGGDEFAILAPYKLEKCRSMAEKILRAISSHVFNPGFSITASIGIAGGRRRETRSHDTYTMLSHLINLASLASTKAKNELNSLVVYDGLYSSETA